MTRIAATLIALLATASAHAALSPAEKKMAAAIDASQERDVALAAETGRPE